MATNSRKPAASKKRQKISRTQRKSARPKLVRSSTEALARAQEMTVAGVQEQQAGNFDKAAALFRKALKYAPEYAHALHFLGVVHHQEGNHEKARELIERAIALEPAHPKFYNNLGAVQSSLGDVEAAAASLRIAIRLEPGDVVSHTNLAVALKKLEDWEGAIEVYEQAPPSPKILNSLADLYNLQGRFDDAITTFHHYLDFAPDDGQARNNLAFAYEKSDHLEQAETQYRRALEQCPEVPEIAHNLGTVLRNLGRNVEAEIYFKRANDADPDAWHKISNLATLKAQKGHYSEAFEIFERLLENKPNDKELLNNYGMTLVSANRPVDALKLLDRVIEIDPDFALAYVNRANAKTLLNDRLGAVAALKKALELQPGLMHALVSMGVSLMSIHRYDEAYFYARSFVMAEGYIPALFSNPHKVFRALNDFDGIEELGDIWAHAQELDALARASMFLELLVLAGSDEEVETLVRFHREWGEKFADLVAIDPMSPAVPRQRTGKIRLGFMSADLRSHSVAKFISPLFDNLDRNAFEINCYSPLDSRADANQQRFVDAVDTFRFVMNYSDRELAEIIRNDNVDILFDLHGFTQSTRIGAMGYRSAPVQVAWLGYPFTTGVQEVDYFLLDAETMPENKEWLCEKSLIMPESWVCLGEYPDDMILNKLPYERADGTITFGTLNNPYKFTLRIFDLWARIMIGTPNSRFLIVRPECRSKIFVSNICKEFGKRGIGPERLYFVNNRDTKYELDEGEFTLAHMYYYDEIDISLDTFPVTGGTTTCDALWMGVPVVSLYGPSLHHRISYSILKTAGLGELCTKSPDEYVEIAVALAQDHERLHDIRANTRDRMRATSLCDAQRFTKQFQDVMMDVVKRHNLR